MHHKLEKNAVFISSPVFRRAAWGHNHPLAIPRQSAMLDLCDLLGWLPAADCRLAEAATPTTLARFHDRDYINAFMSASQSGKASIAMREKYHFGTMENPLFPGLFERAATTVGGSILGAELALDGHLVFHPSGGTHHGRRGYASGFCYFNDPVFAIMTLLDHGVNRVFYVDLDAHHGDGVEAAFSDGERVFTLSIHEENRWPYSGTLDEPGRARVCNIPVPKGFNDSELDYVLRTVITPACNKFRPEAVVVTCGADGLAGDPLSGMALSNGALWDSVLALTAMAPIRLVLGGGGYNPWTVARCWAGLWGRLSNRPIPETLPEAAQMLLRSLESDLIDPEDVEPHWITALRDPPAKDPIRPAVIEAAKAASGAL